jgi:hypothetical protein
MANLSVELDVNKPLSLPPPRLQRLSFFPGDLLMHQALENKKQQPQTVALSGNFLPRRF